MSKQTIQFLIFIILIATDAKSQNWELINIGTDIHLESVYFINDSTGFIGGNNKAFRTVNGGETWTEVFDFPSGLGNGNVKHFQFLNESDGFLSFVDFIYETEDGGQTWTELYRLPGFCDAFYFKDSQRALAISSDDIYLSNNGGVSWSPVYQGAGVSSSLNDMFFIDNDNGWCVGEGGLILHSSNGGITWNEQETTSGNRLNHVFFTSVESGWAAGGFLHKTNNSGENWEFVRGNTNNGLHFFDADTGYMSWGNLLVYTEDNGISWDTVLSSVNTIHNLDFPNQNLGWAVGNNGTVYKYSLFVTSCDRASDSLALVELYNMTDGENWTNPWDLAQSIDSWDGVTLNGDGCVEELRLVGNGLSGTLPDLNLPNLQTFYCNNNSLSDTIPDFSNTSNLQSFQCNNNSLSGQIPNFSNIPNLQRFFCFNNGLSGSIPDFFNTPNLQDFRCSNNSLSDEIPDFSNTPNLETFECIENGLSGSIPDFSNLLNLLYFVCNNNNLSGVVPDFADNCPNLRLLKVQENTFTFSHILSSRVSNTALCDTNADGVTFWFYDYAPQDTIFTDTLIQITENEPLTIDLGIDEGLASNVYTWYKDGQPYTTINGDNDLNFTAVQASDAGVYTVEVTNAGAPDLTLVSYPIEVVICGNDNLGCIANLTVFLGQECLTNITPDMLLAGDFGCLSPADFIISIDDENSSNGSILDGCGSFGYTISLAQGATGNFGTCWGTIFAEDNEAPIILAPPNISDLNGRDLICQDASKVLLDQQYSYIVNTLDSSIIDIPAVLQMVLDSTGYPVLSDNCGNVEVFVWDEFISGGDCDPSQIIRHFYGIDNIASSCTGMSNFSDTLQQVIVFRKPTLTDLIIPDEIRLSCIDFPASGTNPTPSELNLEQIPHLYTAFDSDPNTANYQPEILNDSYCNLNASLSDSQRTMLSLGSYSFTREWMVLDWCDLQNPLIIQQEVIVGVDEEITQNLQVNIQEGETYAVGNSSFDTQGNYEINLLTQDGCDSIVYLSLSVIPACRLSDSLALINLYNANDGPNWTFTTTDYNNGTSIVPVPNAGTPWNFSQSINTWHGVAVNLDGCVEILVLNENGLSGVLPDINLPNLQELWCRNNQLTGQVPDFSNLPKLKEFYCDNNELSGLIPDFADNCPVLWDLEVQENTFTFEHIISSRASNTLLCETNSISANFFYDYAPQDTTYTDTLIIATENQPLTIDLGIDEGLASNVYNWYKDGNPYTTINGNNDLSFASVQISDAGVYTVEVTNAGAPDLTLVSYPITLSVTMACDRISDSLALVELYEMTDGENWTNTWNLTQPMDMWYGVTLSDEGCVTVLILNNNGLDGLIPDLELPNLQDVNCSNNLLSGAIPDFSNLPALSELFLVNNHFSGIMPDLSDNCPLIRDIQIEENLFTFEHILTSFDSNVSLCELNAVNSTDFYNYAPQDTIFTDTLILATESQPLTIDLGIDEGLGSNVYNWFKDGLPYTTINGDNDLSFASVQASDAGVYYVEVTNAGAPDLTLVSFPIEIQIVPNCLNDAGTIVQIGPVVGQSNDFNDPSMIYLCLGDSLFIDHAGDEVFLSDPNTLTPAGIGYAFYNCPPTVSGPNIATIAADPCATTEGDPTYGFYVYTGDSTSGDVCFFNDGNLQAFFNNDMPVTQYFAPITFDALFEGTSATYEGDPSGECLHVSTDQAFGVTYLNEVNISNLTVDACQASFQVQGGLPEFDGSDYPTVNIFLQGDPGTTATITSGPASHNGFISFVAPTPGTYIIEVEDGKSCGASATATLATCTEMSLLMPLANVMPATNECLPVIVEDFNNIVAMQFSVNWDPAILSITGVQNFNPLVPDIIENGNFGWQNFPGPNPIGAGVMVFSWSDNSFNGVSLADGETFFEICFDVIGQLDDCSPLDITNSPVNIEVINNEPNQVPLIPRQGKIQITDDPFFVLVAQDSLTCPSFDDGGFTVTVNEGTPPYQFSWNTVPISGPNNTEPVINANGGSRIVTDLPSGLYQVTITDSSGPALTVVDTVEVLAGPTLGILIRDTIPTCFGERDGSLRFIPTSNGFPVNNPVNQGYTFNWDVPNSVPNPGNTAYIDGIPAGAYGMTLTDPAGCQATAFIPLGQPPSLRVLDTNTFISDASCTGGEDGEISITAVGGTTFNGDYQFSWDTGLIVDTPTSILTNLNPGQYCVTVTDDNDCQTEECYIVGAVKTLNIFGNVIDITCNGNNDGEIFVTGNTSGAPADTPYTFNWSANASTASNTATTSEIANLMAGEYSVTMTDASPAGCQIIDTFVVTQPAPLIVSLLDVTNETCIVGFDGSITIGVNGGTSPYGYTWSHDNGLTDSVAVNLSANDYIVNVMDTNSCTEQFMQSVSAPTPPSIDQLEDSTVSCTDETDAILSVFASPAPGTSLSAINWSNGESGTTISGLSPGQYIVTVTADNACTTVDTALVFDPPPLQIPDVNTFITDASCTNGQDGDITITPTGGTTATGDYQFSWDTGFFHTGSFSQIANLNPGIYCVTVTDDNDCQTEECYIIQAIKTLSVDEIVTDVSCNGLADGELFVTGNTSGTVADTPYTFVWSANAPAASNTTTTSEITGLTPGSYSVTMIDAGTAGCQVVATYDVVEPEAISLTATDIYDPPCNGTNDGQVTVFFSDVPPFNLSWNTVPISGPDQGPLNFGSSDGITLINLSPGQYIATITDGNNCQETVDWVIGQPDLLDISIRDTIPSCFDEWDGSLRFTPTVNGIPVTDPLNLGYSFAWSTPINVSNPGNMDYINNIPAGNYGVTITAPSGCEATALIPVSEPVPLLVSVANTFITNASCTDGQDGEITITPIGGTTATGNYQFSWDTGLIVNTSTSTLTNLNPGQYCVTVTDDNDCQTEECYIVSAVKTLNIFGSAIDVTCNGNNDGEIFVTGSTSGAPGDTPYIFNWSANAPAANNTATTSEITNLIAGEYSVTMTDASPAGCQIIETFAVAEPEPLFAQVINVINETCIVGNDGSIMLEVTGGTYPYNYNWNHDNMLIDSIATGLSSNNYNVNIIDNNGCEEQVTQNIFAPAPPQIVQLDDDISCAEGATGNLSVFVQAGSAAIDSYEWSNGLSGETITNLPPGEYMVTVTDLAACTAIGSAQVLAAAPIVTNLTEAICQGQSYSVGTSTYTASGSYQDILQAANECDSTVNLQLTMTPPLTNSFSDEICNGETYLWGSNSYTEAGNYEQTFTTAEGCDSIVTLNLSATPSISDSFNTSICPGSSYNWNGTIYTEADTYQQTFQTIDGCDSIVTLTLSLLEDTGSQAAQAGQDSVVCSPDFQLNANLPLNTMGAWTNSTGVFFSNPLAPNALLTDLQPGSNTLTWTLSTADCPDYSSDDIVLFYEADAPIAVDDEYTFDREELSLEAQTLDNDMLSTSGQWLASLLSPPALGTSVVHPDGSFLYTVFGYPSQVSFSYLIESRYCSDLTDSATVNIQIEFDQDDSDGFTPNNDGVNDVLIIPELQDNPQQYEDNEITIFNRWGQIVFYAKPYNNDWDGTHYQTGQSLPAAAYFYNLQLDVGRGELKSGMVVIVR